jgi:hypothetical protein
LERRHKSLEQEIAEVRPKRSTDNPTIVEFKRRKLHIRDEIEEFVAS